MEKMLAGLLSRRYGPVGLEPVGEQVTAAAKSTSKSAVSRKFVAQTDTALGQLLAADLSGLDLVALMVDGVHFAQTCCVVALGIDLQGNKIPLSLVRARPRTPRWSPNCSSGCASAGWTSPGRSWLAWTAARHCTGR